MCPILQMSNLAASAAVSKGDPGLGGKHQTTKLKRKRRQRDSERMRKGKPGKRQREAKRAGEAAQDGAA